MKSIFTLPAFLLFVFSSFCASAQIDTASQWAWMKGDNVTDAPGVYGTQGVAAAANKPGARYGSFSWTDAAGNLWLFGGVAYPNGFTYYNDLWKYSPVTNLWTWVKGANITNDPGTTGTQGIPDTANNPSARSGGARWVDAAGNFWLFGGNGRSVLSDLWKYNPTTNQWTWVNGSNIFYQLAVHGTMGVPAATNTPGIRTQSTTWTGADGNLWLFGGYGSTSTGGANFNDLWKYNPTTNQWTWVNGANTTYQQGVYGTLGTAAAANRPGAREAGASWVDEAGNCWLFGGIERQRTTGSQYHFNDLWKYNLATNQWTWVKGDSTSNQPGMYGTRGVTATTNNPGARAYSVSWTDISGNFWLFGGNGYAASGFNNGLNDLWKYSATTNQWTWIKGANTPSQPGIYGTAGTPAAANRPGARQYAASWRDNGGSLWLFGGNGIAAVNGNYLNDLWKLKSDSLLTPSRWAWVKGDSTINQAGVYGTKGVADIANKPGARTAGVSWKDAAGDLWLFSGSFYNGGPNSLRFNDLWKYSPAANQWTWVHGSSAFDQPGVYGTKGVAGPANMPGARDGSVAFTDMAGNFWLFGGQGSSDNAGGRFYNDLWKYTPATNLWTWVSGDSARFGYYGVYGTKGVPAATNKPGARTNSTGWLDGAGNLWLLGGQGFGAPGGTGFGGSLNDLWKYNPATNQWTWMNGTSLVEQPGIYGTQGTAAPANTPGGRNGGVAWSDTAGALWLFGGSYYYNNGTYGLLNDLWKYNTTSNQWAWIGGANIANQPGVYGTKGTAAPANIPGARGYSVSWKDAADDLWLFGGTGYFTNYTAELNDLWKYNAPTNQWTWVDGSALPDQRGLYGATTNSNVPGSRSYSVSWADAAGNFWLFGGRHVNNSFNGLLNDLWRRNSAVVAAHTVGNGSWNNPATWAGGVVPGIGSAVIIRHTITVAANASCYSLNIQGPNGFVTVVTGVQFTVLH